MPVNVWGQVGAVVGYLPMVSLIGTPGQLLGMNPAGTLAEWKAATFLANQLAVPGGSGVGAPAYTFTGNLATGMYQIAANRIGFAINGVKVVELNATNAEFSANVKLIGKLLQEAKGADIVAGAAIDLALATGNYLYITNAAGTANIADLGGALLPAGTCIETKFVITGGLVNIIYDVNKINLPSAVNLAVQNNDVIRWRKTSSVSNFWELVGFARGINASIITAKGDLIVGSLVGGSIVAGIKTVGTDGQVLAADSAQVAGVNWVTLGAGSVRQSILAAKLDATGYNNAISAGVGLTFNISGTATPLVMTYASGFGLTGGQDLVTVISADAANQGALVASNTNYVHSSYLTGTTTTWGNCLIPPQYGYVFDRSKQALLNFEGANGAVVTTDDAGNTWTLTNGAQISTTRFKFGTSSAFFDGVNDYIRCNNILSVGDGSWQMECWVNWNALPGVGNSQAIMNVANAAPRGMTLQLENAAGVMKLNLYLSTDGVNWIAAPTATGASVAWVVNTWYKIRLIFDALGGNYKVFISNNGALETLDITYASTARINSFDKMLLGISGDLVSSVFSGWIDAFRFLQCVTNASPEVPAAVAPLITDYPINYFNISQMKAYEVTAASVVAGTDPTLTQRSRLFVGETDTGPAAVVAVRNYAIKGQYRSAKIAPFIAVSSSQAYTHNIGVKPDQAELWMECLTTENGYIPGDRILFTTSGNAAWASSIPIRVDRNSASIATQQTTTGQVPPKAGGAAVGITLANWGFQLILERGW